MSHLEIRSKPVEELIPAPYNPRTVLKPRDPAYRKLRASLEEFGLVEPLIWNETTGHLVGGHARLRILREAGVEEVPVSVVRLSPERERALNVVLNNYEAQGRFDAAKLTALLTELEELPELDLTGFDRQTLANLRYLPGDDRMAKESSDRVEITIVTTSRKLPEFEERLDELVRDFYLEVHVRNGTNAKPSRRF